MALAALFGSETGDEVDKFSRCRWAEGRDGVPILADCPRWLVGTIRDRIDTGDHTGYLLDPVDAGTGPWAGQLGFRQVRGLEPGHPA
jgi:flavin reductase (DIM6/NTAB) family NADH-FMN oxidoreductase RutF